MDYGDKYFNVKIGGVVPSGIAYQRPISTGRLTSFRNGDYGYHRALGTYDYTPPTNPIHIAQLDWTAISPFITLKDNNVFGNKSRFTDQFGNQPGSFVNNYVIDHLTGLAWKRVLSGLVTWNDAIDAAQIEVFEGESGWRVSSIDETHSILDYTTFNTLNYSPMSLLFHSNNQWTSVAQSGTNAYYHNPVHGNIGYIGITNTARFLLCRNHFN